MSATGSTIIRFFMFAVSSANVKSVNGVAKKNCPANIEVNDCKTKKQTENIGPVVCFFGRPKRKQCSPSKYGHEVLLENQIKLRQFLTLLKTMSC